MSDVRVNSSEVREVFTELDTRVVIVTCIKAAHLLIERVLVTPERLTDEETLKELERYLAAHFAWQGNPGFSSQSGTGVSGSAHRAPPGKGLDASPFGTIIGALDHTGLLAQELAAQQPVIFEAFGT